MMAKNPNQHGFRSGRSCLSQLLEQHDLILDILDEGLNADVVYLDFSKHIFKLCLSLSLSLIEVDNHPQALDGDQLNLGVAIFMLGSALVPLFAGSLFPIIPI